MGWAGGIKLNLILWETRAIPIAARTSGLGCFPLQLGLQLVQNTIPSKQTLFVLVLHITQSELEAGKHEIKKHLWILAFFVCVWQLGRYWVFLEKVS